MEKVLSWMTLEYLGTKFGVTDALVGMLEKAKRRTSGRLSREVNRFECGLMNHVFSRYGRGW